MKLLPLNNRGMSHLIALVFVVGAGLVGVYTVVASHAASAPSPKFCQANDLVYKDGKCISPTPVLSCTTTYSQSKVSSKAYSLTVTQTYVNNGASSSPKQDAATAVYTNKNIAGISPRVGPSDGFATHDIPALAYSHTSSWKQTFSVSLIKSGAASVIVDSSYGSNGGASHYCSSGHKHTVNL